MIHIDMGLFSSTKRMSMRELEDILRDVSSLQGSERAYVRGVFSKYDSGGISKRDVRLAAREMMHDTSDIIGRAEARAIKRALLDHLRR